jgi:hypothetical protein
MLCATSAGASEDMKLRVVRIDNNGARETVGPEINPISVFVNSTIEFACFCLTEPLISSPSSAEVELLRNAFSIAQGGCGVFHTVVFSVTDGGEYQCRGNMPGSTSPPFVSVIRNLAVLDPDALVTAPPVQHAISGTSHTLQCEVENENAIVYWMEPGVSFDDKEPGPYVIDGATLEDEGEYTCVVYFSEADVFTQMTVQLYVVGETL